VVYSGISSRLADELEALCRSLGVPACYRSTETKAGGYLVHQVRVSAELQALLDPVQARRSGSSANPKRLGRSPADASPVSAAYGSMESSGDHARVECKEDARAEYSSGTLEIGTLEVEALEVGTLEKPHVPLADSREYLVEVASIERSEAWTYDIEVEDSHSYVVNGLVSHNTINAPNDDTRENVSRAIFRAYEAGCKGFTYYRDGSRTEQVVTFSKDGDIKGGNRDVAAKDAAATPEAMPAEPVAQTGTKSLEELDIDALLAKANALLEVR